MKLVPDKQNGKTVYKCTCCGKVYEQLPLCFGAEVPDLYDIIPEAERASRIEMNKSLCIVDKKYFLHRGRLTIPIINNDDRLIFDIWTTISEADFAKRMNLWEDAKRVDEPPYAGWLNSYIPTYGNTINIRTIAVEQVVGCIPDVLVMEEGHPLAADQRNGITLDKALEIVSYILSDTHKKENK